MEDISALLREKSPSFASLTRYLLKSDVVLGVRLRSVDHQLQPRAHDNALPIDTAGGVQGIPRPNGPKWEFFLDSSSSTVYWKLQDTLNLKKYLMQHGFPNTACSRHADLGIRPSHSGERMRSTYLGTVLERELGYHSDNQRAMLLCSQSNLLRDTRWVNAVIRYMLHSYGDVPTYIVWTDPENPSRIELRKVR